MENSDSIENQQTPQTEEAETAEVVTEAPAADEPDADEKLAAELGMFFEEELFESGREIVGIADLPRLMEFLKQRGIKLTLADEFGNFDGGIVIKSRGVDKNFTFEVEIQLLKEELETQVAKEIFG